MGRAFRQIEQVVAAQNGNATFTLRNIPLALNGLTIWAVSGGKVITDLTFQPQINGIDFGGSVQVAAGVAANVVYSGGVDEDILPEDAGNGAAGIDPFVFTVDVLDAGNDANASTRTVTIYAVGLVPDF